MNWKFLLLKKSVKARIPFADRLRWLKRKIKGYECDPANFNSTLRDYEKLKERLKLHDIEIDGAAVLEVGSGWFPIVPLLLLRDGAAHVTMTDLNVHMDDVTFNETVVLLKKKFPGDYFIQSLTTLSELPLTYLAPFSTSLVENASIDLILSRAVLEHLGRHSLFSLFRQLLPKLAAGGCSAHLIDHSDHFEHHDKSLSRINFLTWSDERHVFVNWLATDGENRLRHHEYLPIFADAGYCLVDEWVKIDAATLARLSSLNLAYPFCSMSPEQLAAVTSTYVLRAST